MLYWLSSLPKNKENFPQKEAPHIRDDESDFQYNIFPTFRRSNTPASDQPFRS
jgi:hypothetical protein